MAKRPGPLARLIRRVASDSVAIPQRDSRAGSYNIPNFSRQSNIANEFSGMGGGTDKGNATRFRDSWLNHNELETIYRNSWAAQVMVDAPIDDMWVRGRKWTGDEETTIDAMDKAEKELEAHKRIAMAMKAGRLFGGALLVIFPKKGDIEKPLDINQIQKDGIANFWVVDKDACSIETWETDYRKPGFGMPATYRVAPRVGGANNYSGGDNSSITSGGFTVHASWCVRFDGLEPPLTDGWWYVPWDRHWGISILTKAINELERHEALHAGIAHLVQEASIFSMGIQGFKEALMGQTDETEPTIQMLGNSINLFKSIYRVLFRDSEDTAERIAVQFGGLPDLIDREIALLAAMAGIPATRFYGQSPVGMNATGSSDAQNYAMLIMAKQESLSNGPLLLIDKVLARHAGLDAEKLPEFEWIPLVNISELERAEAAKLLTDTAIAALSSPRPAVDEEEVRTRLSQIEFWGELGDWEGVEPTIEQEMQAEMETEKLKQQGEMNKQRMAQQAATRSAPNGK